MAQKKEGKKKKKDEATIHDGPVVSSDLWTALHILRYLRMLYAEYRKSDTYSKMRSGQSHAFVYNTRSLSEEKYCLSR